MNRWVNNSFCILLHQEIMSLKYTHFFLESWSESFPLSWLCCWNFKRENFPLIQIVRGIVAGNVHLMSLNYSHALLAAFFAFFFKYLKEYFNILGEALSGVTGHDCCSFILIRMLNYSFKSQLQPPDWEHRTSERRRESPGPRGLQDRNPGQTCDDNNNNNNTVHTSSRSAAHTEAAWRRRGGVTFTCGLLLGLHSL